MNNNPPCITYQGACFWEKSKSGFPNPKTDFAFFFLANPKTNHESIKSTLRVDSSDQIYIQIFEIQNLSVFLGKDLKKVFLTSGFSKKKNCTHQMPYMCDILTKPLQWGLINFEPLVTYHSMHVCHLFNLLVNCF